MDSQVSISLATVVYSVVGFVIVSLISIVAFFLKGAFGEVKAAINKMADVQTAVHDVGTEVRGMVGRLNSHTTTLQAHEGRISAVERDQSRIWVAIGDSRGTVPIPPPPNGNGDTK